MIRSIIVEDEKTSIDCLMHTLEEHLPEVEVLAVCTTVAEGVKQVKRYKPDLVFLDIEFKRKTEGFDLIEQTSDESYNVIFTTGHAEPDIVIDAIERASPLGYLLKPISLNRLKISIEKVKEIHAKLSSEILNALKRNFKEPDINKQTITLPVIGGYDLYNVPDIILCGASGNYTDIHLKHNRSIKVTKTLKEVEEKLYGSNFFRVHHSFLVNLRCVQKFRHEGDGGVVLLDEGHKANVSRRKKDDFLSRLDEI